jgi:hypothetical protein
MSQGFRRHGRRKRMGPPGRRQPDDREPCFSPDWPSLAEGWLNRRPLLPGGRARRRQCRSSEPSQEGAHPRELPGWPWCRWPARPQETREVCPFSSIQVNTPRERVYDPMISGRYRPWNPVPRHGPTTDARPSDSSTLLFIRSNHRSPGSNGTFSSTTHAIPRRWEAPTSRPF